MVITTQNNDTANVRHDGDNCTMQSGVFRPRFYRTHGRNYLAPKERKSICFQRGGNYFCVLLIYGGW